MTVNAFGCAGLAAVLISLATTALAAPAPLDPRFDRAAAAAKSAMVTEPQKALAAARAALAVARLAPVGKTGDLETATANWLIGEALTRTKHPDLALPILDGALSAVVKAEPGGKLHGDILKSRGHASTTLGHVQAALQDFQNAFRVYQGAGERRGQAMALQEIGSIYTLARDYPHQLQYYAQARETYPEDPVLTLAAENNGADALKNMGRLPEAEAEFRKAYATADHLKSSALRADILATLAFTEALDGKTGAARADVMHGLALANGDPEARTEKPFLLGVLAKVDAQVGDDAAAAQLLDQTFKGVDLAKTQMEFKDFHELAANVYEAAGEQTKALQHLRAFKRLDDQGRALAASTNAALVAGKFDFANQATKIAELKLNEAQSRTRFTLVLIGILVLGGLIVTSLITHAFFTMRRSRNQIRAVNTELETANGALEKALKAKTEFLATTSHEIRTPLNGILGMAQVMLADRTISSDTRERLGLLKSAGDTMNAMVSDLLDVAKIENSALSVQKADLDLHQMLEDMAKVWRDQAKTKGLNFELELAECPKRVVEDGDRLRQVLANLLSNATKFTETGTVTLSAREAPLGDGEGLVISVCDTGIGIPADQHARIFESFTQVDSSTARRYGGTGLGLTICRNIVLSLGGQVTVQSAAGAGATFSVHLPLERAAALGPTEAGAARGLSSSRLLVLDDNLLTQAMLRALLADKVQSVIFEASVEGARAAFVSGDIDAVLIDGAWVMRIAKDDPVGLVSQITRATHDPVLVLWPGLDQRWTETLLRAGVARAIAKPVAGAALLQHLESCLCSEHAQVALPPAMVA